MNRSYKNKRHGKPWSGAEQLDGNGSASHARHSEQSDIIDHDTNAGDRERIIGGAPHGMTTVVDTLGSVGVIPTERERLRNALVEQKSRMVAANIRIVRALSAEADLAERAADQAEESYRAALEYHQSLGM